LSKCKIYGSIWITDLGSVSIYPDHRKGYNLIKTYSSDDIAWSLFCASNFPPKYEVPKFPSLEDVSSDHLLIKADSPLDWKLRFEAFC
jgi:hypothetical protein